MKSTSTIYELLKKGFITQKQIKETTGLSQSTISRSLKELGEDLLILAEESPKKYALPLITDNNNILAEVDEHGKKSYLGQVYMMAHGKYFVKTVKGASRLYLGNNQNGLYGDLPFFLDDLKPQGFLGNQIAMQLNSSSKNYYPKNLTRWHARHIFQYLVDYGDDLLGNLKFGKGAFKSLKQLIPPTSVGDYDFICQQIGDGALPNSSAGGEQQKFTAFSKEQNAHVLVKYTSNENDPVTRRWKDVLVTEYHALKTLRKFDIPAAEVNLIDQDNRFYLETKRFDRIGKYGRSSMFSLLSIDMEFTGLGENWYEIADQLSKMDLLSHSDKYYISFLWRFSQWIGNTDTHLGNMSFGIKGEVFSMLPIYDMCSMGMAPQLNKLSKINLNIPKINGLKFNIGYNYLFKEAVLNFWKNVANDERISTEFNDYLIQIDIVNQMEKEFSI